MGTVEQLLIEVSKIFQPLSSHIEDKQVSLLMAELGLELPATADDNAGFTTALGQFNDGIHTLFAKATELKTAIEQENIGQIISITVQATAALKSLFDGVTGIGNSIKNDIGAGAIGIPASQLDAFLSKLPKTLIEYLFIKNLENNLSPLADTLELLKVIQRDEQPATNGLPAYTNRELHLNAGIDFVSDPVKHFENHYDWRKPGFNGSKIFESVSKILLSSGIPAIYDKVGNPSKLNLIFVNVLVDNSESLPGIAIEPTVEARYPAAFSIVKEGWEFKTALELGLSNAGKISIFPNGKVKVAMPGFGGGKISASFKAGFPDKPFTILEIVGGSKIEAQSFKIAIESDINNTGAGKFAFRAELNKINVVIDFSGGDGFIKKIGGSGFKAEIDLAFGYAAASGLFIEGSGVFEIQLPLHISLGPVEISGLTIGVGLKQDKLPLSLSGDIKASLGPIVAVVQGIGIISELSFPPARDGNLGAVNIEPKFKPPIGIGLSIDAGVVKGGGYILFDDAKKQYAGALELSIMDTIQVAAICVITTRMPDGSDGFSLLIIISVTFSPGISLSMGFFLSGLGGILGIHRTINVDGLREGVKNNAVDHILFPENIIENITTIIQQITTIFPPKKDQFMIGLMARITWGVPALITIDFGIVIEFASPTKIAILGVVKIALPTEEAAILQLQVNFVGIIDFEKGMLSFDASIYNSRILTFTLEGDMALRLGWGQTKGFLLSVGGFHPQFTPPASLKVPSMKRLTLTILADNPRLVLTCYFAVTSNTVQLGARIDFRFAVSEFKVVGYLYFDALFQFSPFRFIVGIGAGLEVKMGDCTLFGITLDFELAGPTPWNAKGTASFSILFFTIKVRFDEEWGEKNSIEYPKIAVLPKAMEALQLDSNWTTELPLNRSTLVSTRDIPSEPGNIVLQPFGSFKVSQTILPIAQVLDKFGDNLPADIKKIDITQVKIGSNIVTGQYPTESFAPAMFKKLDEKQKLKAPSYEEMKSGIRVTETDEITVLSRANRRVDYEVHVSDFDPTPETPRFTFDQGLFKMMIKGGAIGNCSLSREYAAKKAVKKDAAVSVNDEAFVMMNKGTMDAVAHNGFSGGSFSDATDALNDFIAANPAMKGKVKIVPAYHMEME